MFNQGTHPVNLAVRFMLEIAVLLAVGVWGFSNFNSLYAYIIGIGAPIFFAIVWGVFAVPNDPSRSGKTVIKTLGSIRLILELNYFIAGSYALYSLNYIYLFYAFSIITVLHYLLSIDRIKWLLNN